MKIKVIIKHVKITYKITIFLYIPYVLNIFSIAQYPYII
jgi:hypothetical protein